jgi:hypothetical protein
VNHWGCSGPGRGTVVGDGRQVVSWTWPQPRSRPRPRPRAQCAAILLCTHAAVPKGNHATASTTPATTYPAGTNSATIYPAGTTSATISPIPIPTPTTSILACVVKSTVPTRRSNVRGSNGGGCTGEGWQWSPMPPGAVLQPRTGSGCRGHPRTTWSTGARPSGGHVIEGHVSPNVPTSQGPTRAPRQGILTLLPRLVHLNAKTQGGPSRGRDAQHPVRP